MIRLGRPLVLGLVALGLCAGSVPVAIHEGYWAGRPARHPSRYTPADAMRLRPGQYRWAPYADDGSPMRVVVDLTHQRAFAFQGDALIGIAAISTGRRGHGTPTGNFPVLQKARYHRSNIYSDAPMPYMQRLTWGGIALHAGYNPGRPASHGCIRLPTGFARALFAATRVGSMVMVTRGAPLVAPPAQVQAPPVEMVSTAPEEGAAPVRQVNIMSTGRTVAYVVATML